MASYKLWANASMVIVEAINSKTNINSLETFNTLQLEEVTV